MTTFSTQSSSDSFTNLETTIARLFFRETEFAIPIYSFVL